ncbi:NUDIX hydrolase [Lentzea chajnantorensis]
MDVEPVDIIGVYSDPDHAVAYTDGEVREQFSICFRARLIGGDLRESSEPSEVLWVIRSDLDRLNIHPSIQLRILHGFENRSTPYFAT